MPETTEVDTNPKPTVIIVGAGLGGLLLGALLERVDIPYIILERASSFKPLGNSPSIPSSSFLIKCLQPLYDLNTPFFLTPLSIYTDRFGDESRRTDPASVRPAWDR